MSCFKERDLDEVTIDGIDGYVFRVEGGDRVGGDWRYCEGLGR